MPVLSKDCQLWFCNFEAFGGYQHLSFKNDFLESKYVQGGCFERYNRLLYTSYPISAGLLPMNLLVVFYDCIPMSCKPVCIARELV